jgi:hypothetical protein
VHDVEPGSGVRVGVQFPQRLARLNRHLTNPIQRLWAGRIPAHGILEHVYGKSFGVTDPPVVGKAEAAAHVTRGWRPIFARVSLEQAVLLTKTG